MADDTALPEPDCVPGFPHPRAARRLVGQGDAERAFLDALAQGRLHHAWLLRGPRGIGKATLAYKIARMMIAKPPDDGGGLFGDAISGVPESLETPGDCPVQARIEAQSEPRLSVLRRTPQPTTGRMRTEIVVDDVRAVRRFLSLSAADGGWRVIIVDDADLMNRNAANALLKFLEEPPAETLFLLISHAPAGLLPTIRSRCRTLDLSPLGATDLGLVLEALGVAPEAKNATALAQLSGGSVGDALRFVAGDGLELYRDLIGLLRNGGRIDRAGIARMVERCAGRQNDETYRQLLDLIKLLVARLARAAGHGRPPPEAAPGEQALIARVAATPEQGRLWAELFAEVTARSRHAVAVNLDPGQTILDTFLQLDSTLARLNSVAA
ncbi:MAG: DNA polymerase III subunit delta' [Pseudomonadota bacterium]